MIGQETNEVERKVIAILNILSDSQQPLGARVIARRLSDFGIDLGERAVRYHLELMDERHFTYLVGRKDGRLITQLGLDELNSALVADRVGAAMSKIEMLTYKTSFDPEKRVGEVPINVSLFPDDKLSQALEVIRYYSSAKLYVSDLAAIANEGERLGEVTVPKGKIGLATISDIVIGGVLLKAGIRLDFRFAGILQIRNHECLRFADLIEYTGSSRDPSGIFLASKMTSVSSVVKEGNGKILASFCELPALALSKAEIFIEKLETAGIDGLVKIGRVGDSVCETVVGRGKVGMILSDGLNLVAIAVEAGIEVINHTMSGVIDFAKLKSFKEL